ncbi:hypothetical protein BST61_g11305 [Cercospora zeina]
MDENTAGCSVCQNRSDWDFLKDFFLREQTLLQRQEDLYNQQVQERQDLQSTLAAVRLSYYSAQAHLATAEDRSNELKKANADLQCQRDSLREQLNLLDGVLRESQRLQLQAESIASEQQQITQACNEVVERQEQELQAQAAELKAAEAAARELGDMMSNVVSANDFAAAAFRGAVNVADLVMRNKFLETELASYKADPPSLDPAYTTTNETVPLLEESQTLCSYSSEDESYVPLDLPSGNEHGYVVDESTCDQWEAYRELHPLIEDGLP